MSQLRSNKVDVFHLVPAMHLGATCLFRCRPAQVIDASDVQGHYRHGDYLPHLLPCHNAPALVMVAFMAIVALYICHVDGLCRLEAASSELSFEEIFVEAGGRFICT